jgi:hypothetical protein
MGIDYSSLIYLPNYDMFARAITVTPTASQPGAPAYTARGILNTDEQTVQGEDGSLITDQRTLVDVRDVEFGVVPQQGDLVTIPADGGAMVTLGDFEIINAWKNGGGETTLQLRSITTAP